MNHVSRLSSLVPVLPATGLPKALAPPLVPSFTTSLRMSVIM